MQCAIRIGALLGSASAVINRQIQENAVARRDRRRVIKEGDPVADAAAMAGEPLPDFVSMPGYLIRRSKQTSTGIFMEACKGTGITPIQFAALSILRFRPGIDQTEVGELAGLDASTTGGVIHRLQQRGLVRRSEQGHRRICHLTAEGETILSRITPLVRAAQQRTLAPLTARERLQLLRLMSKLNGVTNRYYTAPAIRRRRRRTGESAAM
jgi:DNA-binding MarR family transcriptional regulator